MSGTRRGLTDLWTCGLVVMPGLRCFGRMVWAPPKRTVLARRAVAK